MSKTLLLVDDDPKDRLLASKIFLQHGFEVLEAENGLEVKSLLIKNATPDVSLVDITLPDTDGYEVSRMIKQHCDQCFVIITSGSPANNKRLYESKGDLFLIKGFETNNILKSFAAGYIPKKSEL